MKNLKALVEEKNFMRRMFNQPEFDLTNLDNQRAQELFEMIDCDLSPENLTCDGERPRAQVMRAAKILQGAHKELQKMGFVEATRSFR